MNVRQDFKVEMALVDENGLTTAVAPQLCAAVTAWEVETLESEDDTQGFLVPDTPSASHDEEDEDETDDDDNSSEDDDEEDDGVEVEKMLTLRSKVNKAMLAEFKELTSSTRDLKVRIVYGNEETGTITKEFDCDTDAVLALGNADAKAENSCDADLEVELLFDVYGSDTLY